MALVQVMPAGTKNRLKKLALFQEASEQRTLSKLEAIFDNNFYSRHAILAKRRGLYNNRQKWFDETNHLNIINQRRLQVVTIQRTLNQDEVIMEEKQNTFYE